MKAHRTLYELATMPITELLTYKHELHAYDLLDARTKIGPVLLDNVFLTGHNILSGLAISGSTFFKATNHITHCDTYPN